MTLLFLLVQSVMVLRWLGSIVVDLDSLLADLMLEVAALRGLVPGVEFLRPLLDLLVVERVSGGE